MAAYENIVEKTIIHRIGERFQLIRERQNGEKEISHQVLQREQTRFFDGEKGDPDNTNFFSATIRESLEEKIHAAQTHILSIESPEFYAQNNFETAKPQGATKQGLLQQIETLFVDPSTNTVKQSYINAFGGMDAINTLFVGEGFTDANNNPLPEAATPLDKFKSFLINAYYNQYNQELGAKAINLSNLQERLSADPALNVTIKLWQGIEPNKIKQMDMLLETGHYDIYEQHRTLIQEINNTHRDAFLDTIPLTAFSLDGILDEDTEITSVTPNPFNPTHGQEPSPALASLMNEADGINASVAREPRYWSTGQANNSTLFQTSGCNPSAREPTPSPEAVTTSESDKGCRIA